LKFITYFARAHRWILPWATWIQLTPSQPKVTAFSLCFCIFRMFSLPSSDRYNVILFLHACATCLALSILHHLLPWTVISTKPLLLHSSLLHISPQTLYSPPHSKLPLSETPKTCWIVQVKD
jgi:hypothetical protein